MCEKSLKFFFWSGFEEPKKLEDVPGGWGFARLFAFKPQILFQRVGSELAADKDLSFRSVVH